MKAYFLKTIHLQVLIHCSQIEKALIYFYENKKRLYRLQALLGLNNLSFYEDH